MKMFIWKRVSNLTEQYHSGGGLVIVARDLDRAREDLTAEFAANFDNYGSEDYSDSRLKCGAFTEEPDLTIDVEVEPMVLIFEDSGCC